MTDHPAAPAPAPAPPPGSHARPHLSLLVSVVAAVVTAALAFALIPRHGVEGVAIASALGYFSGATVAGILFRRVARAAAG